MVFMQGKTTIKEQSNLENYKVGHMLPILTAKRLLSSGRHQGLLHQLRELSGLSEEYHDSLYKSVVVHFAEFVQVLPSKANGVLSGLLNESLARGVVALQQYLMDNPKDQDPLIRYAIFTAGLLRDVSKVIINQKIILVDEDGIYVDEWRAFEGSMVDKGEYFKMYELAPIYQRLETAITPMLARQLMPVEGFNWIASDLQVLADWLAALNSDDTDGRRVSRALSLCRREDIYALYDALVQMEINQELAHATQLGETFFAWLKNGIRSNDIKVNAHDSGVFMTEEGVFLEWKRIFKQFTDIYGKTVSLSVVFTQFGNMFGFVKKGGQDFSFAQYFSETLGSSSKKGGFQSPFSHPTKTLREGLLLADPAMVFTNSRIPAVSHLMKAMQAKLPSSHKLPAITVQKQMQNKLR